MAKMSKIIAHRGAHILGDRTLCENSAAAFQAAAEKGARWLETDVRLIADGSLVLFHDDDLQRIYQRKDKISAMDAAQAKALGIVFLEELLAAKLLAAKLPLGLNLELKLDKNPSEQAVKALPRALAKVLGASQNLPPLFVSSFHHKALEFFKRERSDIALGLACVRVSDKVLELAKGLGAASVQSSFKASAPADIKKVRSAGFESYVYTINDSKQAEPLWQAGMTGMFTDELDKFQDYL